MRTFLLLVALLVLCSCNLPKRATKAPNMGRAILMSAQVEGPAGAPVLDTVYVSFPVTAQFPVAVVWDQYLNQIMRYYNADIAYSPLTFYGGTDPKAVYLLGARTTNASILSQP